MDKGRAQLAHHRIVRPWHRSPPPGNWRLLGAFCTWKVVPAIKPRNTTQAMGNRLPLVAAAVTPSGTFVSAVETADGDVESVGTYFSK